MIRRLLVANRGEIARRIFTTCRAVGIETVAVYSDPDAGSPHVREADRAVRLAGSAPAGTYLRGDLIIDAARRTGADAIHPGYGFLSENAEFAAAVTDAGLTWVGPPAKAIAAMGAKLEAKAMLAEAGVPMLPSWTGPGQVTEFPVLVKASAGGGGRGMRVVRSADELDQALAAASREAAAAFGDGTVFCEKYLDRARHVEVQVFGDAHGTVRHLGERECSIQRRHQKIIEESPSPAVSPSLREALCAAAVAAAQAIGYVGAGTVEFLLAPDGRFYFLEMNTRLQVEHPVTECVTGLDLVRLQLLVAEGAPLPADLAGGPPGSRPAMPGGHAIEARLYAEEPANGWRPATGTLHRFRVPATAGIRLDSGVEDGSEIGVHYDPMLAKVIAWAPSRTGAARLLAATLARAEVHGVATNRDLLVRVLRSASFLAGETDTGFLERHPEVFAPLLADADLPLCCLAAALAGVAARREGDAGRRDRDANRWSRLPAGWRNVPAQPQGTAYESPAGPVEVRYQFDRTGALASWSVRPLTGSPDDGLPGGGRGADGHDGSPGGDPPEVAVIAMSPESVVLDVAGVRQAFRVHTVGEISHVDAPDGSVALAELARFPLPGATVAEGSLTAPMPGTVSRVAVAAGQQVAVGDLLLTLEAMKLEHPMYAPAGGTVAELRVTPGAQVEAGTVLAVVTPD